MKTTIITEKTGAGNYNVTVCQGYNELGTFETTDMQLIDDIHEMNNDGFQHELSMHETFEEVIETCLNLLPKWVICDNTQNTGKPYISEDLSNTGVLESAWIFDSKEAAQKAIDDNGWDWAYVEEF